MKKKLHLERYLEIFKEVQNITIATQQLCEEFNLDYTDSLRRKGSQWLSKEGITEKTGKLEDSLAFREAQKREVSSSKYYIITSAQNSTTVNREFLSGLETYASSLSAEILVIPTRYKNPTSVSHDISKDDWDDRVKPYLIAKRHNIHKKLTILGDVKIQPTASMPLTGLEGMTGLESSIIGHPRQHLKTVPTIGDDDPKFLLSTGMCTVENYTDSKAGKKGEFHHTLGFVIVEIKDEDTFFIRQVSAARNGSFYDLDTFVSGEIIKQEEGYVEAVTLGDIHLGHHDPTAIRTSKEMLIRFKPKHTLFHDIMDGSSISHHEKQDPFIALEREQDGSWNLQEELDRVCDFLAPFIPYGPVIVKSNHDIFVDRWLLSNDWRKEKNKYAYLEYAKLKADKQLPNGILPYNIEQRFGDKVKCLTEDESFKVRGTEFGIHGHTGVNGSRGSAIQYKKLNVKLVTAHSHNPLKMDNLITVGTNTLLRVGYNKGLSGWFHANSITHKNGKTQLILIHGEKGYTTLNS